MLLQAANFVNPTISKLRVAALSQAENLFKKQTHALRMYIVDIDRAPANPNLAAEGAEF